MKFWKWKIDIKAKRLDVDERIGYLANELIEELKASGRSIQCNNSDKDFGHLDIWVHHLTNEDLYLELSSSNWSFKTKPTFKEF